MNPENKFARILKNSGPARFFVPIGIVLIVFGVIMFGMQSGNFVQTTGRITAVTEGIPDENGQPYDVEFTFTAGGKTYTNTFANLSGEYQVGEEIDVFYDEENPERVTNSKPSAFLPPVLIAVGVAAAVFGVFKTVKAFKKSKALDEAAPASKEDFEAFKTAPGVTESYFRFDGHSLKPGYLIEDADKNVLFEGKMLKNALVGARVFSFTNVRTGVSEEHEVGHTTTSTYNNGFFSARSWFKFDGQNIWDVLHGRGLRMTTDLRSNFPRLVYNVSLNGAAFARIESTGVHVHEEDEAAHKLNVPAGRMYYRCWSASTDPEPLFLIMFALSETEQTVAE